jgi:hypothetical protein
MQFIEIMIPFMGTKKSLTQIRVTKKNKKFYMNREISPHFLYKREGDISNFLMRSARMKFIGAINATG